MMGYPRGLGMDFIMFEGSCHRRSIGLTNVMGASAGSAKRGAVNLSVAVDNGKDVDFGPEL